MNTNQLERRKVSDSIFYDSDMVEGAIPPELREAVLSLSAVTAAPWRRNSFKGLENRFEPDMICLVVLGGFVERWWDSFGLHSKSCNLAQARRKKRTQQGAMVLERLGQ